MKPSVHTLKLGDSVSTKEKSSLRFQRAVLDHAWSRSSQIVSKSDGLRSGITLALGPNRVLGFGQCEWLVANCLSNATAANALGANTDRLDLAAWQGSFDDLQIWQEPSPSDACDLCTDATQVLGLPSGFDHVANLWCFSAGFTSSRHDRLVERDEGQ